jgi:hypothetical protein
VWPGAGQRTCAGDYKVAASRYLHGGAGMDLRGG